MEIKQAEARAFLYQLYTLTQGDMDKQESMYDIGESLGLDKTDAGEMAEFLFIEGLAELKTLSGGIGITRQGLEALDIDIPVESKEDCHQLGTGRVLEDQGKEVVGTLIQEIKDAVRQLTLSYDMLEEMVIDIKTIEIQMLSPHPKTRVVREIFGSLQQNLMKNGPEDLTRKINILIS